MLNSSRSQSRSKQERHKEIGPRLPIWAWEETAFSINQEPYWYVTVRLQGLMWNKRGKKLKYQGEKAGYEYWGVEAGKWTMQLRRDKELLAQLNFRNCWEYLDKREWKKIGQWYETPGDYRKKERKFWFHWRIAICSCKKDKWDIREFMIGRHRWDLCKSCMQGEIVRYTEPKSLQRLTLLHIARENVFQVMPLWRARRVPVQGFPWCRELQGYTMPWTLQECWEMDTIFE
uniref:Vif protein n=1 Tax=Visna-maedi virus TaxID=2169971 RepID=F5BD99_9RETR|nr:vif protein [Visna-maedi virus]